MDGAIVIDQNINQIRDDDDYSPYRGGQDYNEDAQFVSSGYTFKETSDDDDLGLSNDADSGDADYDDGDAGFDE